VALRPRLRYITANRHERPVMMIRLACLAAIALTLAACGRAGAPLRPEPGTIVMQPDAKPAETRRNNPFILDPLL
jgi:predicted small lipoprotein YifL